MKQWLLIIDGGATKTACAVVHAESGDVEYSTSAKGSNYQAIGVESATAILQELLANVETFLQKYPNSQIAVATFALAGIDSPKDHTAVVAIVQNALQTTQLQVDTLIIENDAEATLLGVTAGQAGALLIAGTGAIAYAYDGQQIVRAGGWGHRAGDEGSGYWLGQEVVRAIFKMEDGRGKPTILKEAVYQSLGLQDVTELAEWLFHPSYTNAQLAKMGSFVAKAVEQEDACAIEISQQAAYELVLLASAVLKKIDYQNEPFTFYCNGGAIKHNPLILKIFTEQITFMYPQVDISLCQHQPITYLIERTKRAYDCL
ncbi:N-acetylglucosamine kinase [Lysinibacillus boronitolerans]|uniref:N-acetylglucosamine kinase n=1 Tax=Lysinibacillus boronitolerans TaxID=309788 RepID=UPI002899DF24|nr:BadF/BadG/BcrA/BcrD ATPase family protein [Lysinibacillus boronitolerans]